MKIYPSLISADLLNLADVLKKLDPYVEGYHLDVMDDHFVPNLTWGPAFIRSIAATTIESLHVHLMVSDPARWLDRLPLAEKDTFVFHWESCGGDFKKVTTLIHKIRKMGWRLGIAISPKTSVLTIKPFIDKVDEVLVMSVEPGFSGQTFIDVFDKIDDLIAVREHENLSFLISMDGGINQKNIALVRERGVDLIGVASAIFDANDYVQSFRDLCQKAC